MVDQTLNGTWQTAQVWDPDIGGWKLSIDKRDGTFKSQS